MSSGSSSSSDSSGTSYTGGQAYESQTFTPTEGSAPAWNYLTDLTNQAAGLGPQVVGPSEYTQTGLQGLSQAAANQAQAAQTAQNNYGFLSNAADVANNPYVQAQLAQNASNVTDQLTNQWLPQVNSGAQQVNALGSSRQGLMQGQAVGDAAKALANANANTQMNAYNSGLAAQQNALGSLGSLQTGIANPANTMLGAGQTQEAYQQALIDAPWNQIQNIGEALQYTNTLGTLSGNSWDVNTGWAGWCSSRAA